MFSWTPAVAGVTMVLYFSLLKNSPVIPRLDRGIQVIKL